MVVCWQKVTCLVVVLLLEKLSAGCCWRQLWYGWGQSTWIGLLVVVCVGLSGSPRMHLYAESSFLGKSLGMRFSDGLQRLQMQFWL